MRDLLFELYLFINRFLAMSINSILKSMSFDFEVYIIKLYKLLKKQSKQTW